jgi:hypothetical protein
MLCFQLRGQAFIFDPSFERVTVLVSGDYYQNGDELVCKGSGGVISNLMEMVLVRG